MMQSTGLHLHRFRPSPTRHPRQVVSYRARVTTVKVARAKHVQPIYTVFLTQKRRFSRQN
jgi:hypothetical protein